MNPGRTLLISAIYLASATAAAQPPDQQAVQEAPVPQEAPAQQIAADVEPVPTAPEEPAPTCAARAREAAWRSVVRVHSGGRWGAGFVYRNDRTVVTSFSIIAQGQGVTVVTHDGRHVAASVRAHDDQLDVAVLELNEAAGGPPLAPAPETATQIGREVVALGHPFPMASSVLGARGEGLLRWSLSHGIVAAANDVGLQVDMQLSGGYAGGPLVDCEGRVLGSIAGPGILGGGLGLVPRIGRADDLLDDAASERGWDGGPRLRFTLGGVLSISSTGQVASGGYLGIGGTLFDRLSWITRVGLLGGGTAAPSATELSLDRQLVRVESLIGWRFFIDIEGAFQIYIEPVLGAVVLHDALTTATASVVPAPAPCTPSMTETCTRPAITRTTAERWTVRPAAGLSVVLGDVVDIGYTFELDVDMIANGIDPGRSFFHALRLGILF